MSVSPWGCCAALGIGLVAGAGQDSAKDPKPLACGSIERVYRLTPRLLCGSRPKRPEDFQTLARLGVQWIVSVDGIPPDVEAARAAGLRYIHIPLDYGSISDDEASRLVRAVETAPGAVFLHCHHGKYRGPAASAIVAAALEGWSDDRVAAWLAQAGLTPQEYPDLYASATTIVPPARATLDAIDPASLPERSPVPDLVERMVEIDAIWEELKEIKPGDIGDPALARQLGEQFREAARLDESRRRGEELVSSLNAAARDAFAVEAAWRGRRSAVDHWDALRLSCVQCHRTFRNREVASPEREPD